MRFASKRVLSKIMECAKLAPKLEIVSSSAAHTHTAHRMRMRIFRVFLVFALQSVNQAELDKTSTSKWIKTRSTPRWLNDVAKSASHSTPHLIPLHLIPNCPHCVRTCVRYNLHVYPNYSPSATQLLPVLSLCCLRVVEYIASSERDRESERPKK